MKSVQIRGFFGPYFPDSNWIQENTDQKKSVFEHFQRIISEKTFIFLYSDVPSTLHNFYKMFLLRHLFNNTGALRNQPNIYQTFGRAKDGNRGKFIGSNLVIFCYKEFEKFTLCNSVSQLEVIFIVYSEPIESGHVKMNFS